MNRREFFATSSAAAAAGAAVAAPATALAQARRAAAPPPMKMKLGSLCDVVDDPTMKQFVRYGIRNIYARAPIPDPNRLTPTVAELEGMLEIAARNGVSIDILRPKNNLAMTNIDRERFPAIMLGQSPQRDRDIEEFQNQIRNCAKVGIPAIRYTLSIVGNQRTGSVPGRGDSRYSQSKMSDFKRDAPLTKAGVVTEDMYWERITYFLDRVVPVANEYKVTLLSHMEDAMVPPEGYQGLHPVTNTVEGAKKFCSIQDSPYHGLLFCVGTFAEMKDPASVYDVIRWFGERKKIHLVDFRNIRGNRQEFVETFPDEGDIDMARVIRILRDVGYDKMVAPDHIPKTPDDPNGAEEVNAFQYGYIRGLMHAVERSA